VVVKSFYWKDKGYYLEAISTKSGDRVRRIDNDHDLYGVLTNYSLRMHSVDFHIGYSYLSQERPGPPTSWKLYKTSSNGLAFDKWMILSNSSRHHQHAPFISGRYSTGRLNIEGGVKYLNYSTPSLISYGIAGIPDVNYKEAVDMASSVEANASARSKKFELVLPNFGLSYALNKSLGGYFAYGRNYGMSVSLYPYFIQQKDAFYKKGITLQSLWDKQKLEIADNYDLGLRYIADKLYVVPSVYYARHKNKSATYYDTSLGAAFPSTVFDADAYGFEMEAGVKPLKNLSVYSSFSYNRFYFSHDISSQSGAVMPISKNQVPDAPRFMAKGIIGYSIGGFVLSPVIRFTSSRYGDILQQEKIDGAALVDFDIAYKSSFRRIGAKALDLSLGFNNILNKKYISIINTSDYATLGTTYQAGAPFTVYGSVSVVF